LNDQVSLTLLIAPAWGSANGRAPDLPGCTGHGRICAVGMISLPNRQIILELCMEGERHAGARWSAEEPFSACLGDPPRAPREIFWRAKRAEVVSVPSVRNLRCRSLDALRSLGMTTLARPARDDRV